MAKRLPRPKEKVGYRLEWDAAKARDMDVAAAQAGLSVSSFCRVALEILVARGQVSMKDVIADAIARTSASATDAARVVRAKKKKAD